ncbi:unnamed protein product [Clonostachys rhizophaga]|uniref:Uncharacterized protein n=1 Tax=Clonostachys rhizophaga TaxID=160324 RepID=A0A9N9VSB2_9HYPO|nr:unnamed protein product [Clonostachys rhizophaga]
MAVAALHAMHVSVGSPIMLSHAVQANSIHVNEKQLDVFQSQLLHHCITLKQKALKFLSIALQNPHQHNELQTFGTAVVLTLLECFETGAGSWAIHLDGAKKLLDAGIQKSSTLEAFVEELILFEIFGSTFVPSNVVSTSITTRTFSATSPETILLCNSFVCPVELLQQITLATAKSRIARQAMLNLSNAAECTSAIEDLKADLIKIQQFHSLTWVEKVISVTGYLANVSRRIIAQMCLIWKISAAIYVSRLLYTLTGDAQYLSPIVDDLINAFIPIQNKVQLKFLLWPAVIAGISTTRPDHRAWTLSTLDEIWRLTHCANAKGAAMVLKKLWEMKDARIHEIGDDHGRDWDWLCDMSTLDGYWLLF